MAAPGSGCRGRTGLVRVAIHLLERNGVHPAMTHQSSSPDTTEIIKGVQDAAAFCDCSTHPDAPQWAGCCRVAAMMIHKSATTTIDDVPSCGSENDYRRATPTAARGETTGALIRNFLQKKYGTAAVQVSSDGMERIYYNGVSLLDLADALSKVAQAPALPTAKEISYELARFFPGKQSSRDRAAAAILALSSTESKS